MTPSRATRRLNERGSARTDTVRVPPRTAAGAAAGGGVADGVRSDEPQAAATVAAITAAMSVSVRVCLVNDCPTGQKTGRP